MGQPLHLPPAQVQPGNILHQELPAGGGHPAVFQGHLPAAGSHQQEQGCRRQDHANTAGHPLFKNLGAVIRLLHGLERVLLFPGISLPCGAPSLAGRRHQVVICQHGRPGSFLPVHSGGNFIIFRKVHYAGLDGTRPFSAVGAIQAAFPVKQSSGIHKSLVHEVLQILLRIAGNSIIIEIRAEPQKHQGHDQCTAGEPHRRLTLYRVRLHIPYIPAIPCP